VCQEQNKVMCTILNKSIAYPWERHNIVFILECKIWFMWGRSVNKILRHIFLALQVSTQVKIQIEIGKEINLTK